MVLVQTAGAVAGVAKYYQKSDVQNPPWDEKKVRCPEAISKIMGILLQKTIYVIYIVSFIIFKKINHCYVP